MSGPLVGVLALQGAFEEHQKCLEAVGCRTRQVSTIAVSIVDEKLERSRTFCEQSRIVGRRSLAHVGLPIPRFELPRIWMNSMELFFQAVSLQQWG
jgi:hypothetical protein